MQPSGTHNDSVGTQALTRELQRARQQTRGNILHAVASYKCVRPDCPVRVIKIAILKEPGCRKFQGPNRCCRCMQRMRYIGLDVGR
jgi:hypothetical protein